MFNLATDAITAKSYITRATLICSLCHEMIINKFFLTLVGDRPHANDQDREAGLPSKKTALSEKSAEKLMEAIQTYKQYKTECAESLKGNFFWLINNILKSLFIFFIRSL